MKKKVNVYLADILAIVVLLGVCLFLWNYINDYNEKKNQLDDTDYYEISFDTTGGSVVDSIQSEAGYIDLPKETFKTDYQFIGWTLNNELVNDPFYLEKDVTLVANWLMEEKELFTIRFNLRGGTGQETMVSNEGLVTITNKPQKEGYIFNGWLNSESQYIINPFFLNKDIDLYADWLEDTGSKHTVTFNVGGEQESTKILVESGTIIKKPFDPYKENSKFLGWYLGDTLYDFNKIVEKDIELTAKWQDEEIKFYVVSFNGNGASGQSLSQRVVEGEKVIMPDNPVRDGYTFTGWELNDQSYSFDSEIYNDTTLDATWIKNEEIERTYIVDFNLNGGSGNIESQKVAQNGVAYRPGVEPTRPGYTFMGWYHNNNLYDFNTKVSSNITLKAQWTKTQVVYYTVTFNMNGGNGSNFVKSVAAGGKVSNPGNPTRSGYTFLGWYYNNQKYNFNTAINQDIDLVARWQLNPVSGNSSGKNKYYTVSFYLNGGKGSVSSQNIKAGGKATKPTNPTRSGYTFNGWYYNGTAYNFNQAVNKSITLTARWTKNPTVQTCSVTPNKYNVTGSGVQTHCLTQTCTNSKLVVKNSNTTSINCKSGYVKKYYLKSSTCKTNGSTCSSTGTSTCQQEWYYTCEAAKTVINVPVDSRPVTRDNFKDLVLASGYKYNEVSAGLDSGPDTNYKPGNYSTVVSQTKSKVSSNNNANTTVIINTTSYMFGGLLQSRDYEAYGNKNSKISSLKSLLTTYTKPRYYVTFVIPRNRPEKRAIKIYDTLEKYQVCGLECFWRLSNNHKVSFEEATMEWAYLKSLKKNNPTKFNSLPSYVREFYNFFEAGRYAENSNYEKDYFMETGTLAHKLYESVFTNASSYLSSIYSLKTSGYIDELIIGTDDIELPAFVKKYANDKYVTWIPKDSNNNPIRYSFTYDIYKQYLSKKSATVNFLATDEINHLILGREVVRYTKKKVNFSYSLPESTNKIKDYGKTTPKEVLADAIKFVNNYGTSSYPETMQIEFVENGISSSAASTKANTIYGLVDNGSKNVLVLQMDDYAFSRTLLSSLVNKSNRSVFEIPAISGWNTVENTIGIGLSRAVVYTNLDYELSNYDLSTEYNNMVQNYVKSQMGAVLEDSIYNSNKKLSSLNTDGNNLLKTEYGSSVKIKIGDYKYSVTGARFTATNPWKRAFEPHIIPSFTSVNITS